MSTDFGEYMRRRSRRDKIITHTLEATGIIFLSVAILWVLIVAKVCHLC